MRFKVQSSKFKVAVLCVAGWCACLHAQTGDREILREADRARGNREGIRWTVMLESHEFERVTTRAYEVTARHFDFLAVAVEPPRLRGNRLLMRRGSMWFYKPDLSKPVPISRRQKLSGTAAYGDIASTNYEEDYAVKNRREESLNGTDCWVFELEGRTKKVTYDNIKYWIARTNHTGIRADYFTVSGKKIKSATMAYTNAVEEASGERHPFISRMTIFDELMGSNYTVMTFSAPKLIDVPERTFDVMRLSD